MAVGGIVCLLIFLWPVSSRLLLVRSLLFLCHPGCLSPQRSFGLHSWWSTVPILRRRQMVPGALLPGTAKVPTTPPVLHPTLRAPQMGGFKDMGPAPHGRPMVVRPPPLPAARPRAQAATASPPSYPNPTPHRALWARGMGWGRATSTHSLYQPGSQTPCQF